MDQLADEVSAALPWIADFALSLSTIEEIAPPVIVAETDGGIGRAESLLQLPARRHVLRAGGHGRRWGTLSSVMARRASQQVLRRRQRLQ